MKRWSWYIVWLLFIGMTAVTSVAAEKQNNNNEVFTLGEVVVLGERQDVNSAATVTEVPMAKIEAEGAQNIAQALEFLPGVMVQQAGKGEYHVSLRGFNQNEVKVLIDGVPARENYFGTVDLSMLPADDISKIVVVKGPSSVLYGSDTMGGVINIITRKGGATPFTSFSASFGDYGTANYFLNQGAAVGNFNYWISAGYQTSNGFRLSRHFNKHDPEVGLGSPYNEDGGKRDLSNYLKKSLGLKFGYDPGDDASAYLSFNYVDDRRGIPTFSYRYWDYNPWRQWQLSLVGKRRLSDILDVKARVFYVKHNDGINDVSWDAAHSTSGKKWFEKSYYDDHSFGGTLQTESNFGKWSRLSFALNYMEDTHKEGDYLSSDCWDVLQGWSPVGWQPEAEYVARTYSLAVQNESKPMARLSLVLGMSYDAFDPTKTYNRPAPGKTDTLNPQVAIVYDITDATRLHASVGKKTRFPTLKELYSTLAGGNPDLSPEKTIAYEMGATHIFSGSMSGETSFFYYDVSDLISYINQAYINIDKATIYGAEASFSLRLSNALNARLNYTYLVTVDKSNHDRDLQGRPRHRVNLLLSYRFPFGLTADMQASYTARQYWEDDNYQWRKLPDYFLINVKIVQKLNKVKGISPEIFFQATNILDQNYYETDGPEPGFNFLAGIRLQM